MTITGFTNIYKSRTGVYLGGDIFPDRATAEGVGRKCKEYLQTCYFTNTQEEPKIDKCDADTGQPCAVTKPKQIRRSRKSNTDGEA
jgi:hypothetical protein